MKPTITCITLGVKDLARSIKFYRDDLCWPTKAEEAVAFIQLNGMVLGLFSRQSLAEDAKVKNDGQGFDGVTLAYNTRTKEEVDDVFALIKRIGAPIIKQPEDTFWGGYGGYFADPDGHLWEVIWNPFWNFDERGGVVL